jgi:DNA-binding NarL/FixJ family response regulator
VDSLRRIREQVALSQLGLANLSGVSASTINRLELGRRKARPQTLKKLAEALNVSVEELQNKGYPTEQDPKLPVLEEINAQLESILSELRSFRDSALGRVWNTREREDFEQYRAYFRSFSYREVEVLSLIADGISNKEIAVRLGLSANTVAAIVASILDKTGTVSRTQVAVLALRCGVL